MLSINKKNCRILGALTLGTVKKSKVHSWIASVISDGLIWINVNQVENA